MIILDPAADKVDDGKAAVAEPIAVSSPSPNEPPPVYTPSSAVSNTSTAMAYPQRIPDTFSKLNPSNFVSIDRKNGSMTGSWLIDPHLVIPVPLRPPLGQDETEQTRRNLNLKTSNGYMDLDISLAPFDPNAKDQKLLPKRLTLAVKSSNGSIKVKLHAAYAALRLPFYLQAQSSNGTITIYIPRSFKGLLILKTNHGSSKFSAGASARLTTFSEVDGTSKCFIGDYSGMDDEWHGDEVSAETSNGSIKIFYEDEAAEASKVSKTSFFGRLLGL